MKRIKEAFRIVYTTQFKDLPPWLFHKVERIEGPGFTLHNTMYQHNWGDCVVLTENNTISVMTREEVDSIIHNGKVLKEKLGES